MTSAIDWPYSTTGVRQLVTDLAIEPEDLGLERPGGDRERRIARILEAVPFLPYEFDQGGYREALADNVLRSSVDAGPPKRRKRFTAAPRPLRGQILMNSVEIELFKRFFDEKIDYGTRAFNFPKPAIDPDATDDTTYYCVAFTQPPSWTNPGGDNYLVSLDLEIQP